MPIDTKQEENYEQNGQKGDKETTVEEKEEIIPEETEESKSVKEEEAVLETYAQEEIKSEG